MKAVRLNQVHKNVLPLWEESVIWRLSSPSYHVYIRTLICVWRVRFESRLWEKERPNELLASHTRCLPAPPLLSAICHANRLQPKPCLRFSTSLEKASEKSSAGLNPTRHGGRGSCLAQIRRSVKAGEQIKLEKYSSFSSLLLHDD